MWIKWLKQSVMVHEIGFSRETPVLTEDAFGMPGVNTATRKEDYPEILMQDTRQKVQTCSQLGLQQDNDPKSNLLRYKDNMRVASQRPDLNPIEISE